jgi:plastocyanin
MRRNVRDRFLLPIALPVGITIGMLALMIGFSRILLNTSAEAATAVALVVSIAILATASVIAASRGRLRSGGLGAMLGIVAGVAMVAGGIALAVAEPGGGEAEGAEGAFAAQIAAPPGASGEGFSTDQLSFAADTPVELEFDNQEDGVPHNVHIAESDEPGAPTLFAGSDVTGPATTTYTIDPLAEGEYYFYCSIHPEAMTGTLKVAPGGGPAGGEGPVISAANLEFDTDELALEADTPTTLTFNNEDAPGTQHNVAIYEDDSLATALFQGNIVSAPDSIAYRIPALKAGENYFQCDIHPSMSGTVIVGGKGGPDGGGGGPPPPPAEPTEEPPVDGGGALGSVTVSAANLEFDTAGISLDAETDTTLAFDNQDAGVPHNLAIYGADPAEDPAAEVAFTFEPFPGPAKEEFTIPGLAAGEYFFRCDVHPDTMRGAVTVA